MQMTSNQPYLLRAFYEWILDNNMTPYIVVDANKPGTQVPLEYVQDGQIVLNISPSACGKLQMGNVELSFEARFGGVPRQMLVPCYAVLAIYARENGAGTVFTIDDAAEEGAAEATQQPVAETPKKKARPSLKIVK